MKVLEEIRVSGKDWSNMLEHCLFCGNILDMDLETDPENKTKTLYVMTLQGSEDDSCVRVSFPMELMGEDIDEMRATIEEFKAGQANQM